ncbi:four-carbon acid sugar kinase family protein [Herbiconiux sp. KACC 21604]|uniref:four-carbon acid sugar kinase family protein n=1 Tax=unclassified Herbiconiux TaxID=2618217 RepID=UPI001490CB3A|nr:four-carbon acid sugar kinase family protein [Herbiconiux sp. SALV-R1]QJU54997.1 four-carbon acid sugar kinase family protein [Herbiconiux sp. SALV-R1]WPO86128.1 four-carbon acid sugar kinase family protein [Herbiconiux sp. KACC 21604]
MSAGAPGGKSGVGDARLDPPADGLVVAFYGDDFTGSTDVMETLEDAGLPTLLFLEAPTVEQLAAHPEIRAVGVAGVSRTMSPAQMDDELPQAFRALHALGAPIVHYKICSTFDSSPTVGSIGRATELLRAEVGDGPTPLVVGVPQLGRYTAFGTLFARYGSEVYRLDRHPTMTVHPMTPMHEADLREHLRAQTALPSALVDLRELDGDDAVVASAVDGRLAASGGVVLLDVDDLGSQRQVGRALHRMLETARENGTAVGVVGSSGVEYALGAAWGRSGSAETLPVREPTKTLTVVGSLAPATRAQVEVALAAGFALVEVDDHALVDPERGPAARADAVARAVAALGRHDRVLVRTPVPGAAAPTGAPTPTPVDGTALAAALGAVTAEVVRLTAVPRLVVAGGDTSGYVAKALGIEALRLVRRLAPGAPLCRAVSSDPRLNDLELCLKAGQIGDPDYLVLLAELGSTPQEGTS